MGTGHLYIEPGSLWENDCVESFNSKLRDELLNGAYVRGLLNVNRRP